MTRMIMTFVLSCLLFCPAAAKSDQMENLFFLHNSTGRYIISQGHVRDLIQARNQETDSNFEFWDHDYNNIGISNPEGDLIHESYLIPDDNTDPDGLHKLWTTSNSARDSILANHQVIAFKSCYPASDIDSDEMLNQYKTWYREMRDFFDLNPNTIFIVMSPPPRHRLSTDVGSADRARAFSVWLSSDEYLAGHTNLLHFDLFGLLAHPDDESSVRNMLRYEYEKSHNDGDSHPNQVANETVGPVFGEFLMESGMVPAKQPTLDHLKAMYR